MIDIKDLPEVYELEASHIAFSNNEMKRLTGKWFTPLLGHFGTLKINDRVIFVNPCIPRSSFPRYPGTGFISGYIAALSNTDSMPEIELQTHEGRLIFDFRDIKAMKIFNYEVKNDT